MGRRRIAFDPQAPSLQPQSTPIDSFARIGGGGIADFRGAGRSLARALNTATQAANERKVRDAERFVDQDPARAQELAQEVNDSIGEGGTPEERLEALGAALRPYVDSGELPEAGNPLFQVAFIRHTANKAAGQARQNLLNRIDELASPFNEDGSPRDLLDVQSLVTEEFANIPGASVFQASEYASGALAAQQNRVQNEIEQRVTQLRSARISEETRQGFRDTVGGHLALVYNADPELVQQELDRLQEVLEQDGKLSGIRNYEDLALDALEGQVLDLARTDPAKAAWLVRRAGGLKDADGKPLNTVGSQSRVKLDDLLRQAKDIELEESSKDIRLRATRKAQIVDVADGLITQSLFEAAERGEPLGAALRKTMAGLQSNEEIAGILSDMKEGALPRDILGAINGKSQILLSAASSNIGSPPQEPASLQSLSIAEADGANITELRKRAETLWRTGELGNNAYRTYLQDLDQRSGGLALRNDLPEYRFNVLQRLDADTIPKGLPADIKQQLTNARLQTLSNVNQALERSVGLQQDPAEARRIAREYLASSDFNTALGPYQQQLTAASDGFNKATRDAIQAANSYDHATATDIITNSPFLNGDARNTLLQTLDRKMSEFERVTIQGQASTIVEQGLVAEVGNHLANEDATDFDVSATITSIRSDYRNQLRAALLKKLPKTAVGERQAVVQQEAERISADLLAPYRQDQLGTEERGLRSTEEASDAIRVRQELETAQRVAKGEVSRAAIVGPVSGVDPELYNLSQDLNKGGLFESPAQADARVYNRWTKGVLALPVESQAEAWISLYASDKIPFQLVEQGSAETSVIFDGADLRNTFGFRSAGPLTAKDLPRVQEHLSELGYEATDVEWVGTGRERGMRIKRSIDFSESEFPAAVTSYFDEIGEWDGFEDSRKRSFIERLGYATDTPRKLERSLREFRDNQITAIRQTRRR